MQQKLKYFYSQERKFANCVLDPTFQTLSNNNKTIRLRGKIFAVICCLVDNQNELVSREQLIDECWHGNIYTGQKAVTHTICHLRKILKQLEIPATITTLSKQGYLFTLIEPKTTTKPKLFAIPSFG